jgi:hypothetical protein
MTVSTEIPPLDAATRAAMERELRDLLPLGAGLWRGAQANDMASSAARAEGKRSAALTSQDLRDMAGSLDIFALSHYEGHRGPKSVLVAGLKTALARFGTLLLRLAYGRQATFNFHAWTVALAVYELEGRVKELERRLEASGTSRG